MKSDAGKTLRNWISNYSIDYKGRDKAELVYVCIMTFFMGMPLICFDGKSVSLYMELIFCAYMFFTTLKIRVVDNKFLIANYLFLIVTFAFGYLGNMTPAYKKGSFHNTWTELLLFFTAGYVIYVISKSRFGHEKFFKCIKYTLFLMCNVHVFWSLIQMLLFKCFQIDINQTLFVELLHLRESASVYREGTLCASGIGWHAAQMASIFVFAYFLNDNSVILKLCTLAAALLTFNTTTFFGISLCMAVDFVIMLVKRDKRKMVFFLILLGGVLVLLFSGHIDVLVDKLIYVIEKINGNVESVSNKLHRQYYTDYFNIMKNSSWINILFGYGSGCSGYIFTKLYGYYEYALHWSVECDIMDTLYSRGIVGFVCIYGYVVWLFREALKNKKLWKDAAVIAIIAIEGITYQIRFTWYLFIEMLFGYMILQGYDFFEPIEFKRVNGKNNEIETGK